MSSISPVPNAIGASSLSANKPSFSGHSHAHSLQSQSGPQFGAVTASDSTHFGASPEHTDHTTQTPPPVQNQPKDGMRIWDRTKASLTGLTRGLLKEKWGRDLMVSLGIFLLTLPLAFFIPGSHFLLIPGYIGLRRSLRGISGFTKGLIHPDKILKPAADQK